MKTAIITGASRGIGEKTAYALADSGKYDLIAITCHKSTDRLDKVYKYITKRNIKCIKSSGDISDYDYVQAFINEVIKASGRIDTLINNAGISYVGLLTDMTPADWKEVINTNLTSVFNTCRLTVPYMVHEKSGKIINVSSVWGICGASCEAAYSASKGGINAFTKALAKELAPSKISVNAALFGAIDTEMNSHLSTEEKQNLCEEIPYGKMAAPEEAAEFILKLLDMPEYFTGEVVKFDGGWI